MEGLSALVPGQGPVYIYNGVSNLRELKEANPSGAKLFFNGKFSIEDLREIDFVGATVFLNGQLRPTNQTQSSVVKTSSSTSCRSPIKDAEANVTTNGERKSSSSDLKLPIRGSSRASSAPVTKPSDEVTQKLAQIDKDQQRKRKNGAIRSPRSQNSDCVRQESLVEASKSLPHSSNHNHVVLGQEDTLRSCGNKIQNSQTQGDLFQQPARAVQYDAKSVVATLVPAPPLNHRKDDNARLPRVELPRSAKANVKTPAPLLNSRWPHDLVDTPAQLASHKRPSSTDVDSRSSNENSKKPRLEKHDGFDVDKETEELIEEEIRRAKRAKRRSKRGDSQSAVAEHEEIRKLSERRNNIKSKLPSRLTWQLAAQWSKPGSLRKMDTEGGPGKVARLPRSSPLNNVINFAGLEEETVQTKIKLRLAESQLLQEKARHGYPSQKVVAQIRALDEKLAALKKQRSQIREDSHRMDAFRRDAKTLQFRDEESKNATPRSPPLFPASDGWKERLILCYGAVERSEPRYVTMKNAKGESGTVSAEEGPGIKHEVVDEESLKIAGAKARDPVISPQRQVRFALTGVETLL